jgi:hypothetical protein
MNPRLKPAVMLLFALAITACATTKPSPPPAPPPACIPIRVYTPAEDAAIKSALDALDSGSPLIGALLDYGKLRAAARAACSQPPAVTLPSPPAKTSAPDISPPVSRFKIDGPRVLTS